MPDWLLISIEIVILVATVAVAWAWFQGFLNYRAVRKYPDLVGGEPERWVEVRRYAGNVIWRLSAHLLAQLALLLVGILALPIPTFQQHSSWLFPIFLVLLALSLVGMSFHEYLDMKYQVERNLEDTSP